MTIQTPKAHPAFADYDFIHVEGQDAIPFLQGQLTADVAKLQPGQGQLSAHCNVQGRVISLFFLFCMTNGYLLALPHSLTDIALAALKKYSIFYKKLSMQAISRYCLTVNEPQLGLATAVFQNEITVTLHDAEASPIEEANRALLIKHAIPTLSHETSGLFLPHELNLIQLGAVSLTKGCYTGQEIITRMEHKAVLKKHLYIAETEAALKDSEVIYTNTSDRVVGTVVNHAKTSQNHSLALLLLEDAAVNQTLCTRDLAPIHLLTKTEHTHD